MKNKYRVKNCLFFFITLTLICLVTFWVSKLVERKTSIRKYNDFFNVCDSCDVLFLGTSHVINGFFPMELYNHYGITSYNFGNDASSITESYWTLMNALDYTNPKVVVLDTYGVSSYVKVNSSSFNFIHSAYDAFPISVTKIKTAFDLTDDPICNGLIERGDWSSETMGSPLQLLFNYSVYHSRWNELYFYDFNVNYTPEMGAEHRIDISSPQKSEEINGETIDTNTVNFEYLNKIISECKNRNIKLVFTYLPFSAKATSLLEIKEVEKIANQNHISFIDYISMDTVCFETDFYDLDGHLNPSGAKKTTKNLGQYLIELYGINSIDELDGSEKDKWDNYLRKYLSYKESLLREQSELDLYLMLLCDDDYMIKINEPRECVNNSQLIENLVEINGIEFNCDFIEEDVDNPYIHVEVIEKKTGKIVDKAYISDNVVSHVEF